MKKKIAVIDGGFSAEAQISFLSANTVVEHLNPDLFDVYRIRITDQDWKLVSNETTAIVDKNDFSLTIGQTKITFDCVVIMIHGTPGEDGKLPAYFDLLDIPYTTCDHFTATLSFNKYFCNLVLQSLGFKCASAVRLVSPNQLEAEDIIKTVGLPCFVKPNDGGSSFGASPVYKETELIPAIQKAFDHGSEVIIEEFLEGTEVTNGVLKLNGNVQALAITEIATDNAFFDFEAKYKGESQEITPARISEELTTKIQRISEAVYTALDLKGVVRIDYIIREGHPYLIEINTIPGQSSASLIPQQAAHAGIELSDLYAGLIEEAIQAN